MAIITSFNEFSDHTFNCVKQQINDGPIIRVAIFGREYINIMDKEQLK